MSKRLRGRWSRSFDKALVCVIEVYVIEEYGLKQLLVKSIVFVYLGMITCSLDIAFCI